MEHPAWKKLEDHYQNVPNVYLRSLFADDPKLGECLVAEDVGIYFVYSKNSITAQTIRLLVNLTEECGLRERIEAPPTQEQKELLAKISSGQVKITELADDKIQTILTHTPGNGVSIGGIKVISSGWFAARPSGTEDIYEIYAESFRGTDHLRSILEEAQTIVNGALAAGVSLGNSLRRKHD